MRKFDNRIFLLTVLYFDSQNRHRVNLSNEKVPEVTVFPVQCENKTFFDTVHTRSGLTARLLRQTNCNIETEEKVKK